MGNELGPIIGVIPTVLVAGTAMWMTKTIMDKEKEKSKKRKRATRKRQQRPGLWF